MKELSIEQKAKAYDEAIKRAKELLEVGLKGTRDKRVVLSFFPELAESEDEIRKWIVAELQNHLFDVSQYYSDKDSVTLKRKECLTKAITWLEKQGEQKSKGKVEPKFRKGDIIENIDTGVKLLIEEVDIIHQCYCYKPFDSKGVNYSDFRFYEQEDWQLVKTPTNIEQKSAEWSEEDEARFESCIKLLQTSDGYDTINTKWLKSLKDRVQPQPKQEWSEKDRRIFSNINLYIRKAGDYPHFDKENIKEAINWLDSLLNRVQPKQEWSKEDKMQLDAAIHLVSSTGHIETANWLKSIKNRVLQQNITVTDEELDKAKKDAYNDALDKIEYHSGEPTFDGGWSAAIWYLKKKNARPQSTWKPSATDIKALEDVIDKGRSPINYHATLHYILEQLKKLRER